MSGHILATFEFGSINGGENSFLAVVDKLRDRGWKFTALVPPNSPLSKRLTEERFATLPLLRTHADDTPRTQAELRCQLSTAIQTVRPDLVHCNSLAMSRLCGPVCHDLRVPSLGYVRDIVKISRKAMEDINQLDLIVAVSKATRQFHVQRGLSAERSVTIYNGIDQQAFAGRVDATKSIRDELQLPKDSQLVLSCGQIGIRKGLDVLVESFVRLAANRTFFKPPFYLLVVGQRHSQKKETVEYEQALRGRVRAQNLSRNVYFLGWRTDIPAIMRQSTLLVHAARQEPLGRVLLESAAVGLPVVATDVGGTREIFSTPHLARCLVPPDDSAKLARTIKHFLDDTELRTNLAQHLTQHVQSSFTVEACAMRLHQQYEQIASKK